MPFHWCTLMDTAHTFIVKAKITEHKGDCVVRFDCEKVLSLYIQTHWSSALGWLAFVQIVRGDGMPHNYLFFLPRTSKKIYCTHNYFFSCIENQTNLQRFLDITNIYNILS